MQNQKSTWLSPLKIESISSKRAQIELDRSLILVLTAVIGFLLLSVFATPVFSSINSGIMQPSVNGTNGSHVFATSILGYQITGLAYVLAMIFVPLLLFYAAGKRVEKAGIFGLEEVMSQVVFIAILTLLAVTIVGISFSPASTAYTAVNAYSWAKAFSLGVLISIAPWLLILGVGVLILMQVVSIVRD